MAERPISNTPQQSLVLLNDPTYVEAARVFATKLIIDGGSTALDRLSLAFRTAVSREPSAMEVAALTRFADQQLSRYSTDETAAKALVAVGEHPQPDGISVAELAAWTSVARVILNLHETITRN